MISKSLLTVCLLLFALCCSAQQTVGLMVHNPGNNENGYILFTPLTYHDTYLIDKCGRLMHQWTSATRPNHSVYLLPDGKLLRTGVDINGSFNAGGVIETLDWNSNSIWRYVVSSATECQHHDVRPLPNGNILAIVYELKTKNECLAAGRRPNITGQTLWSEKIIEIQPIGSDSAAIVWEWHVWDHLVQQYDSLNLNNYGLVSDHPELININQVTGGVNQPDWLHFNALDYNADLDQIMISSHTFSELWIIDHSTTTAQAASHQGGNSGKGGDLLYRWGNPAMYHMGTAANKKFFGQHNPHWIENGLPNAGSVLVFNNGQYRPAGDYSSIEILNLPAPDLNGNYSDSILPYLPLVQDWIYTAPTPTDFFSKIISGVQQLDNGNILVCSGNSGKFFELDSLENIVWEYINPVEADGPVTQGSIPFQNQVFRCTFYPYNYSGFAGQVLTTGLPIELNPNPFSCSVTTSMEENPETASITIFPNPAGNYTQFSSIPAGSIVRVFSLNGQEMNCTISDNTLDTRNLTSGIYVIRMTLPGGKMMHFKLLISKD